MVVSWRQDIRKTTHFRLPSVSKKRHVFKLPNTKSSQFKKLFRLNRAFPIAVSVIKTLIDDLPYLLFKSCRSTRFDGADDFPDREKTHPKINFQERWYVKTNNYEMLSFEMTAAVMSATLAKANGKSEKFNLQRDGLGVYTGAVLYK